MYIFRTSTVGQKEVPETCHGQSTALVEQYIHPSLPISISLHPIGLKQACRPAHVEMCLLWSVHIPNGTRISKKNTLFGFWNNGGEGGGGVYSNDNKKSVFSFIFYSFPT